MNLQEARKRLPELSGLSDESALNVIHQAYYPQWDKAKLAEKLGYTPPPAQVPERGMLRGMADIGLSVGQGAVGAVKSLADLGGADNAVSQGLGSMSEYLQDKKSDQSKATMANSQARIKEAEATGDWKDQAAAYMNMLWDQPGEMIAQGVGSFAPMLVTGPLAASARLSSAAKAAGMSKEAFLATEAGQKAIKAAADVAFKTNMGVGAAQGVGTVKGAQYEQTFNAAKAQGKTDEEAAALATEAQAYGGAGTAKQLLGGVLGAGAAATGPIERVIAGKAGQAGQGVMARTFQGAVTEAVPEGLQGGQERYAGNTAAIDAGVLGEDARWRGVVGQGLMGGAIGGLLGGGAGAVNRSAPYQEVDPAKAEADAAKAQADALRATKPQGDGPLSKAVGAGIEAEAQKVEAAPALGARLSNTPMADMLGGGGMTGSDPLAGMLADDRQQKESTAVRMGQFVDRNQAMLTGGGLTGNADPVANMIAGARESDATSETNIRNFAQNRAPMVASDAARILDEAKTRGMDFTAAPHPEGGFMVVPRQWVTPAVGQQAEAEIADTLTRMAQADAAPVDRAPRARAEAVDLTLPTADPVRDYVDGLRKVNTPAAKFYVGEFDAGRITPADVQQRMTVERGKTPDERLADAAAQAPKNTVQPGDLLNPKGEPFKTLMSARLAAKKTPGDVIEVVGGYSVRPRTEANGVYPEGQANAQATPVPASQPQADTGAAPGAEPDTAAGQAKPVATAVARQPKQEDALNLMRNVMADAQKRIKNASEKMKSSAPNSVEYGRAFLDQQKAWADIAKSNIDGYPYKSGPEFDARVKNHQDAIAAVKETEGKIADLQARQPEQAQPLSPETSRKLQEAHKALGYGVTRPQVQSMRDRVAAEVETGTTNNGGVVVALKPAAINERREQLQRLDADLALFGAAPTAETIPQPAQQQQAQPLSDAKPVAAEATTASGEGPKDDKKQQAYQLPEAVSQDWPRAERSDFEPSPRQQVVMDAVASALDEGKYYTNEVRERVSELLGVSPEVLARNKSNVQGGDFGYDVYYARRAVEAQRANKKSRQLADEMALKPGDVLGTLVANDYKRMTGVKVVSISDSGLSAVIEAKRGAATVRGEMSADALKAAFDRANERGNRKDTYADFVKSRSKPAKPDMGNPTSTQEEPDAGNPATPPVAEIPATTQGESVEAAPPEAKPVEAAAEIPVDVIPSPDDAQSNTSYTDGQVLQAADLIGYFDEVIAKSEKGAKVKNPRFHIGEVDAGTAREIATYIEGYDGKQRRLRVSGRTLKHVHESRPAIAREIVEQLPGMFSKPDEVLPDPRHVNKRALLVKERKAEEGQPKQKSYVATVEVEIEVEVSDGFIDIVTIMTAPDRSLREARDLKKGWSEGQQRTEQAVNSPHPLTPQEGANPAADFPDARPAAQSVPPTAQPAQAEAPKLTQAEAADLMEWQNMGQTDNVQKHTLFFYESKADKDAKRGRMAVATITKGDRSTTGWMVDGDDQKFGPLALAKKRGMEIGMAKAVADGFVEAGEVAAQPEQKKTEQTTDDRDTFTLSRLNRETGQMEPVTFRRGEYVEFTLVGSGKKDAGEIDGISQARRKFSVGGLWLPMGAANKAERPTTQKRNDAIPMSAAIDKVNAKYGKGLTDADRVPEQKPASKTPAMDAHAALMDAVRTGKATPEQFKAGFEAVVSGVDAIKAELGTKTKADLLKMGGTYMRMRYANENKPDIIDALYREMLGEFLLGESLTYGMGKNSYRDAIAKRVESVDADKLAKYVEERKAAIEEAAARRVAAAKAVADPKTLDDFKAAIRAAMIDGKTRKEAYLTLTPEQRIRYDELDAESTREARETRKRAQKTQVQAAGQTTGGQIIATKHTRDGYDLFVVQLSERLSKEDYSTVLSSAKRMGGWYSSFRGNGATPGFQFKEKASAEAFLKLAGGDTTAAQDQAAQRRNAFEDDRSQTAAERLTEMADRLEAQADEELGRDRKANTERRARFAANAEAAARNAKALAKTMRNIAAAIGDGKAKFLDAVRTKTQVEMLDGVVKTAKYNELAAKFPEYADREKRKGEPPTTETADFAEFPTFTAFRSDLATLARQMLEVDGTKKLGQQLMGIADDVTDAYLDFAKGNLSAVSQFGRGGAMADFSSKATAEAAIRRSGLVGKAIVLQIKRGENRVILSPSEAMNRGVWEGDGDKRITLSKDAGMELVQAIGRKGNQSNGLKVPWQFETAAERLKALSRMGIETPAEFRSAVREFISLRVQAQEADRVKAMELAMVGRNADGLDFFPTPAEVADQMVEAAGIEPDMAVLEPSAGMGHLADRIRAAGAEPDVVELSGDRRELLEAKGFTVVGTDFMQMKPRSFFTYGDVFRAPDGKEGVMRGQGGMGSDRVRLVDDTGNILGYYNRDELTGVRHGGTESGYDRIIMNPPFGDRRDAEHVRHAYSLLKPGGRLVAIMGEGVFFGKDKKAEDFREWLDELGGTSEKLPAGSFMDPSLPVTTGVNARMVVVDKPADAQAFSRSKSSPGVALYRTPHLSGLRGLPVSHDAVVKTVQSVLKGVPNAPQIEVHRTPADAGLNISGPMPKGGVLPDGRIVVFSDANTGTLDVMRTVFHELFHRGLKSYFATNADYVKFMLDLATAHSIVRKGAEAWKKSPDGQDKLAEFSKNGPMTGDRLANYEALAVEESMATMSETLRAGSPLQIRTWTRAAGNMFERVARFFGMDRIADWIHRLNNTALDDFVNSMIARSGDQPRGGSSILLRGAEQGAVKFRQSSDAPKDPEAFSVKGATADQLAHYRGMGMQVLGRRQIVDLYGDMLPELKEYDRLVQRMDADKNESGAEADKLVNDWAKLDERAGLGLGVAKYPGMERKLAELMHDATLAQIDPDKPLQNGDDAAAHKALADRFRALSPKAQEVYRTARDMYADHFKKVQTAIQERIQRSGMDETSKAKMIAKMDADLFNKLKGVYFPLARFGKYVVVSKNAAGETVSVSRAETLAEANKMRREVVKNSPPGVTVSRVYKDAEFNAMRDAVGKGFVSDLMTMLQGQGVGEEVLDSVGQLYLSSLPDLSWAKHGIHRKGTPGFSQDARRAFAQNMFHGARHLAKLRYADQLADKLMDMENRVKDQRDAEGFDPIKAQQVVDEMNARHELLMNPKTSSLSTALTSIGFVWFLGISPAAAMVNLSQTALVAYPVMAAKWGFQKAGAALLSASAEVVRAGNDLSKVLKGDELAAFQKAVDDGTIDVTQAHDLAGVAQGEDERVSMAMRPVMRAASFMFHHAEKFNRQATFIAAYRLAKESGATPEVAFEQAKKATYDGHFDYSAGNRPRIMQGNWQKVLFLFKQYGQNMVYTLTRQAYLSMKGMTPEQRAEARKQLGGLLAMHAMAAGALGLPLVGVLLSAASMLGSDDDEPWDAEVAMRNMMADAMGPKAAEVMAHGLSRLTPWDLSGRVALNKLILPDIQEGIEGQPLWEKIVMAAAGPVAGIGGGFFKGMAEMGQGQYQRGLESMLPVALKNPVKAMRFGEEGVVDKTGVVIKDEVGVAGLIGQASGFRPSEVALATEGRTAIYQANKALTDRRSSIMRMYAQARMTGDTDGVKDAMKMVESFNAKNPTRRIAMRDLIQSVRNRNRRIEQAEQGVYLPKTQRDALAAGRFALAE